MTLCLRNRTNRCAGGHTTKTEFSFNFDQCVLHAMYLCCLLSDGMCVLEVKLIMSIENAGNIFERIGIENFCLLAKGIVAVSACHVLAVVYLAHNGHSIIRIIDKPILIPSLFMICLISKNRGIPFPCYRSLI